MKRIKFNNLVEETKDAEQEGKWSQLPALLLWMIKDLLHIADNARLAFVCKDWESMSLSDPLPAAPAGSGQRRQCVPWTMHQRQNPIACWDFVNLQTKERFTLKPPDRDKITILFSRRGWLLYQLLTSNKFVLYNIHTNAKFIMPNTPSYFKKEFMGSFLTLDDEDDSPPYCVVLVTFVEKFLMASVNDKEWKDICYFEENESPLLFPRSLVVHGHKLYILYRLGGLMSFDMANLLWKKLARDAGEYHSANTNIRWCLMESEGDLVKIDIHLDSNKFSLFKLNDSETGWEKLIQNDQDNRSWVLYSQKVNQHWGFCIKESRGGKKIYQLTGNNQDVGPIILIHDLIGGTVQQYKPPDQDGIWVDLGLINKLPPSCVSAGVVNWLV